MSVQLVRSAPELDNIIQKADANRLIVIDFFAHWCGPCRFIAPILENMSGQYRNASFLKVDVDQSRDIMTRYNVSAMPTFVFIKNKQEVHRVRGANQQELEQSVRRLYSDTLANPNAANDSEKNFLEKFVRYCSSVKYYDDAVYKTLALSVIPEEKLMKEATIDGKLNKLVLLEKLMDWFKNEFFSWCDSPVCENCNIQTKKGSGLAGTPTKEELEAGASRVEISICDKCEKEVRFPRYNDPAKLLETRTGRCGEWANCFTLMASAMEFEVRLIFDVTDHVWTEVYSEELSRWLHCDPCENIIDKPLLYEKGWNKQLSYVVAYGIDHVYDVTWRYVASSSKTASRRCEVRPAVLSSFLRKLNDRQIANVDSARKKYLVERRLKELVEMLGDELEKKNLKGEDYGGRTTGSDEWRRSRGEIGNGNASSKPVETLSTVIDLFEIASAEQKLFEMSYDCAIDQYTFNSGKPNVEGFSKLTKECKNVVRKVEKDWKKCYLCRENGTEEGTVVWHIDLTKKALEKIEIELLGSETFESGKVITVACLVDSCMRIPKSGKLTIDEPDSGLLKITATLIGGSGPNAFQHSQLFRGDLSSADPPKFSVKVWVK